MQQLSLNVSALLLISLLLYVLFRRTGDISNFCNLFSVPFGITVIGAQLWFGPEQSAFTPQPGTVILLYAAWASFVLGALAGTSRLRPKHRNLRGRAPERIHPRYSIVVLFGLIFLQLAFVVTTAVKTNAFSSVVDSELSATDALAYARLSTAEDRGLQKVGWILELGRTAHVYYVPLALYLLRQGTIRRKHMVLCVVVAAAASLLLFTRFQLLLLVAVLLAAWLILYRPPWKRQLLYLSVCAVAVGMLFTAMQMTLRQYDFHSKISAADQIATYFFSSPLAFQELLRDNYHPSNPNGALYTLQPAYYVMAKLGLIEASEYPIGYRPFVNVPFPTNVFTFLDGFTLDFGIAGPLLGALFLGFAIARVYSIVVLQPRFFTVVVYGIMVQCCLLFNLANLVFSSFFLVHVTAAWIVSWLVSAREYRYHAGAAENDSRKPIVRMVLQYGPSGTR
jgi:oligosaccharide repeat unit polymerase